MDNFIKVIAGALLTLILYLVVGKQSKDLSMMVGMIGCVLIAMGAMHYLQPVISFFSNLKSMGKLDPESMSILLRCVGIGILAEIISLICTDAGNAALGKTLQLTASAGILWLSLPLFTNLLEIVEEMLLFI